MSTTDHLDTIRRVLADPKVRFRTRGNGDLHSPYTVTAEVGCNEYQFSFDSVGGVWRHGHVSTYGNGSFVRGPGCDASGYVIRDADVMAILDGKF